MLRKPALVDTQNFGLDELFFVDKVTMTRNFPIHRHSFVELQYFISGFGKEIINGISYRIRPGSFSLKFPWHAHEIEPDAGETLEIYKCSFRMSALEEGGMLQGVSNVLAQNYDFQPVEQLTEKDAQRVQDVFAYMIEENAVLRTMQDEMMAAQIVQLLICFIRNMKLTEVEADSAQLQKLVVQNVMRLINLRYREEKLSCAQIAQAVNYSEVQVARLLKSELGMSFGELLRETRIRNACVLLRNTEHPVEKIGMWVGYRSRAGFHTAFSEQMGLTPKEYRKKHSYSHEEEPVKVLATSKVYTQIIYYLHKHYGEPLSQEGLAEEFHYSTAYLERLLSENGTGFAELLRDIRIYHAKQILLLSEKSIPVVAEETGFASQETFYRVFKKQTGLSPNAYRRHAMDT